MKQRSNEMPVVELRGNSDLRKALRRFAPDLDKELKDELRKALSPVVRKARGYVESNPMSNWSDSRSTGAEFPKYDSAAIRRGIGYSTSPTKINRNGFSGMAKVFNRTAAGAIYEQAGVKNPQGQPWSGPKGPKGSRYSQSSYEGAGEQFINNLPPITSSLKGRGRLIYRAWAESRGLAEGAAMRAIDKATRTFNQRSQRSTLRRVA
jgi:hypothetical protein